MSLPSLQPQSVRARCEPRGRFAFGLTPRAILLLAAGLLLALPGFFHDSWSYGVPVWELLICVAILLDGLRLPAAGLIEVERRWSNAPSLSCECVVTLTVTQRGGIILECRIIDDLPPALVALPETHTLRVIPHVAATLRYPFFPRERGDTQVNGLYLRYRSPLGLLERWALAPLEQRVRVYPALRRGEDQRLFLARARQLELQLRPLRQRGLGRDFESLREYRQGDDLRDICWTATARRGQWITRQFQTERSQAVWIVVDTGRLLQARVVAGDGQSNQSKLDYACSTAVALAQLALFSGDRVGLLAYGQNVQQRLLPARGAAHMRQLVEALAQVRAENAEADHLRATAALNRLQPRRSLILWISDLAESVMRPEVIDGAQQLLRRHLLLFVAMGQPEVEAIAKARPEDAAQMFRASAAQELTGRRAALLARLREQGAMTLDLDPESLTSSLLNQYLKIKERAML